MGSGSIIHGVEHGLHVSHEHHELSAKYEQVLGERTEEPAHADPGHGHADADPQEPDLDPQDMFNMGGLRKKMPITFWTFLIGGLALSGFPIVTAGFWSKDEILGQAWNHYMLVFVLLVFAAFMTAFYTMRQISLTFLGKPRTEAAEYAHESHWTMWLPLVILSVFAIFAGYVGVKADMPGLGVISGTFAQGSALERFIEPTVLPVVELEKLPFDFAPLLLGSAAALLGLFAGWWIYGRKPLAAGQRDPLEVKMGALYTVLQNKYYIDEIYDYVFVQPAKRFAVWMGEVFDRKGIDGVLHGIASGAMRLALAFRSFDTKVVNGGADGLAGGVKSFGHWLRDIQTGRIQNYLLLALVSVVLLIALYITLFS
jgi:NADH-quinone oxidoreductase subunit L